MVFNDAKQYLGLVDGTGCETLADISKAIREAKLCTEDFEILFEDAPVSKAQEAELSAELAMPKVIIRPSITVSEASPRHEWVTVVFRFPNGTSSVMKSRVSAALLELVNEACNKMKLDETQIIVQDARGFLLPKQIAIKDLLHQSVANREYGQHIPLSLSSLEEAKESFRAAPVDFNGRRSSPRASDSGDDEEASSVHTFLDSESTISVKCENLDQLLAHSDGMRCSR